LEKEIEENAAVQQVLTLNRYATQLQQSMTNAIGSVNSIAGTLKQYASGILGTINSAQNFKIQDLIPFFDPNSLSSFQAFTQLKNSMGGLMNNTTSLAGLQSGSQYQWSTLNTYYNRNIINTTLTSAQALNQQQAEIGDERLHIPTLDNLLKLGQSTADMTARNAGLTATAAYQIMSDNTQQALLDQAREEAAARSKRAAIASSLLQ
jgi:lambda repressor-like predicted transcriptional regulator